MSTVAVETKTLAELRAAKGWTLAETGRLLGEKMGRKPYAYSRILQIEQSGVTDIDQIEALASLFEVSFDDILRAVKKLRQ